MKNRVALQPGLRRALLLAVAAIAALAGPVIIGLASVKAGETPQTAPVTTSTAPQGARGAIPSSATQGYRLGEISVLGAKTLPSEFVRQSLGLVSGETYDESKLRKGFEYLKAFYGEGGYIAFLPQPVFDVDEQRKVLNLTVNIDEGLRYIFNRISFTGNTTIPDEVIRREIRLTEGFAINTRLLEASRVRLNQLGLFEEIKPEDFQLTPSPDEPKVDVVLRVKEKRR